MSLANQKLEVIAEVAKVEALLVQQANLAGQSSPDLSTTTTALNAEINAAATHDALDALNLGIEESVAFANTIARYFQDGAANNVFLARGGGKTGVGNFGASIPQELLDVLGGSFLQQGGTAATNYTPVLVGNIPLLDAIWVKVIGAYAFTINTATDGLRIINVSDTANPVVVSTLTFGLSLQDADIAGRYLYVIDRDLNDETLFVVDVSNVAAPVIRGTLALGQNPTSITVSGKYVYITEETAGVLKIVDITDPDNPFLVSSPAVPTGFPQATIVSDGFAYVSGSGTTDFNIIDVTDPLTASAVGGLVVGSFAPHIEVSGKHVFLPDQNPTPSRVHVIDVSDPSTPVIVGAALMDVPSLVRAVKVSGDYLYVTDEAQFELWVFNISDRTAPVEVGRFDFGVPSFLNGIDVVGSDVYIADGFSDTFKIIDISGINVQSAVVHALKAFTAQVLEDLRVGKDLQVRNGLNVGGHALFDGDVGIGGSLRVAGSNVGIFGTEYQYVERTTDLATNNATLQEYTSLTTPSLPAGTYRVEWHVVCRNSQASGDFVIQVQVDDTINIISPGNQDQTREETKDGAANQRVARTGFRDVVLTAGVHTVDMDIAQEDDGTATFSFGNLAIHRVS